MYTGGGSKGGGGGGERGGLGFGAPGIISQGRASTALTSAMLANTASDNSRSGSNSSNNRSWSNNNSNQQQGPTLNLPPALQAKFQKATAVQAPSYVSSGGGAGDTGGSSAFTQSDNLSAAQAVQRALAGGGSVTNTAPAPAAPTPVTVNQDFAANPYIQGHGQGRGKHLTQPSWMAAATSSTATNTTTSNVTTAKNAAFAGVSTTAASLEPQDSPRSQFADSAVADLAGGDGATLKRKSRFSAEEPAVAVPVMAHVPTLPGFIRATATAPAAPAPTLAAAVSSSGCAAVSAAVNSGSGVGSADGGAVSSADTSISSLKPPTKKSRWDT